ALANDNSIIVRIPNQPEGEVAFRELQERLRQDMPSSPITNPLVAATVRRRFADTAYWMPSVTTDGDGYATVSFDFPDNITQWHITARGITGDIKVGTVEAQSVTKKNLLVRLQAPRFFVDRDQVVISANLHNYLPTKKTARVELLLDPDTFTLASESAN